MEFDSSLVTLVEDAVSVAWQRLPKIRGRGVVVNSPPRNVHNVHDLCLLVRDELLRKGFKSVHVVKGSAYGNEHTWIVHETSTAPCEWVVIDVSTSSAGVLNLVASDETMKYAQSAGMSPYYRTLSIVPSLNATDVYIESERVCTEDGKAAPVHKPFADALLRLFRYHNDTFFTHDDATVTDLRSAKFHADSLFAAYIPALPTEACKTLRGPHPYAMRLTELTLSLFRSVCRGDNTADEIQQRITQVDCAWEVLFGLCDTWDRFEDEFTAVANFSYTEASDIDSVCSAYKQMANAVATIGAVADSAITTEPASGSSAHFTCEWSLALSVFFAIMHYTACDGEKPDIAPLVASLGSVYSAAASTVIEIVYAAVVENTVGEGKVVNYKCTPLFESKAELKELFPQGQRKLCDTLFNRISHYILTCTDGTNIAGFHEMVTAWCEIESRKFPFLYAAYDALPTDPAPSVVLPDQLPNVPQTMTCLRLAFTSSGCDISEVTEDNKPYEEDVIDDCEIFTDYTGVKWIALFEYAPRDACSGALHIFLDALGIAHTAATARISALTLRPETSIDVISALPFLLIKLIDEFHVHPDGHASFADVWATYTEHVRRAVQLLQILDTRIVNTVVVRCPASFVVLDLDPSLHMVDQWLSYFSRIPDTARRILDIQRKKFNAMFRMNEFHGNVYTAVSLRPSAALSVLRPPEFKTSFAEYDSGITRMLMDWLLDCDEERSVYVHLHEGVLTGKALLAIKTRRSIIESRNVSTHFPKTKALFESTIRRGMVFASAKHGMVELEVYRDASYFFEVEYTRVIDKVRMAALVGICEDTGGLPTMIVSSGFRNVGKFIPPARRSVVMSAHDWDNSVVGFLAPWVRGHLEHSAKDTRLALQVSDTHIEFLPTVPFICRERGVYFTTSVYLHNAIENTHNVFCTTALPAYDRDSMSYTVDLGEEFAQWLSNRAFTYTTYECKRTRVAPFTRVTGKVYLCCGGIPTAVLCKFEADTDISENIRGDLVVKTVSRGVDKSDEQLEQYKAYIAPHSAALYELTCLSDAPLDEDASIVASNAMAISKYFQSFSGMPIHRSLLEHVPEETYKKAVVQEYYANSYVHPVVSHVSCRFSIKKFAQIMYGTKKSVLIDSIQ